MNLEVTEADRDVEHGGRFRLRAYWITSALGTVVFGFLVYMMMMVPGIPASQKIWMLSFSSLLLVIPLVLGVLKLKSSDAPIVAWPFGPFVWVLLLLELSVCALGVFQLTLFARNGPVRESPEETKAFLAKVVSQTQKLRPGESEFDDREMMRASVAVYERAIQHPELPEVWSTAALVINRRSAPAVSANAVCGGNPQTMPQTGNPDSLESVAIVTYADCSLSIDRDAQIMLRNRRTSAKTPDTVLLELRNVDVSYSGGVLPEMTAVSCIDCRFDLELRGVPAVSGQSFIKGLLMSDYRNFSVGISHGDPHAQMR